MTRKQMALLFTITMIAVFFFAENPMIKGVTGLWVLFNFCNWVYDKMTGQVYVTKGPSVIDMCKSYFNWI